MRLPLAVLHRVVLASVAVAIVSPIFPSTFTLGAQTPSSPVAVHDERWQPWLGCWKPTGSITPTVSAGESVSAPAPTMICVVPGKTLTSVEIVNFSGGTITERAVIEPGQPTAKTVEDCTGSETAKWSADGRRLMLRGTFTCGRNVSRVETGVMSLDADGQWVQVQSIAANKNVATYVARFRDTGILLEGIANGAIVERPVLDPSGARLSPPRDGCTGSETVVPSADSSGVTVTSSFLCAGLRRVANAEFVRGANGQWLRTNGSAVLFGTASVRAAAGAPVTTDDVLEVAKHVDPITAEAWMTDRGQTFQLTGKELVRLADAGMPSRVIDMMVAVSNPQTFTLRHNDGTVETKSTPRRGDMNAQGCSVTRDFCYGMTGMGWLYGADRYYGWSPYGYQFGMGYPFSRYGYGGYGYGGYWGPGYYNGNGPVVVVVNPGSGSSSQPRGRAVYGQGYTRDKTIEYSAPTSTSGSGSSSGSSRGSSGGASTGAASGSSSGGGAAPARTAKPRGGE